MSRPRAIASHSTFHTFRTLGMLAMLGAGVGCSGTPQPTPIEGEPVCVDFELGAARVKMQGGLRTPVLVEILEDDELVSKSLVRGRRTPEQPEVRISVPDANDEFTLRFSTCENERTPKQLDPAKVGRGDEGAPYECGKAKEYAKSALKIRKGDPATRKIAYVAPPNAACWVNEGPSPASTASANATATASAAPQRGPTDTDAGAAEAAADAGPGAREDAAAAGTPTATPTR